MIIIVVDSFTHDDDPDNCHYNLGDYDCDKCHHGDRDCDNFPHGNCNSWSPQGW